MQVNLHIRCLPKIVLHSSTITRLHLRHHPNLHKSSGGHPSKLSPADINYALQLIGFRKAENAAHITETLQDIKNKPLSSQTVHWNLREAGMKGPDHERTTS